MAYQIITINREFASCGSEIAQQVAKTLHIHYVDKFLITEAAQKSSWLPDLNIPRRSRPIIMPPPAPLCPPPRRLRRFSFSSSGILRSRGPA